MVRNRRIAAILAGTTVLVLSRLGPAPAAADPGTILMFDSSVQDVPPEEQNEQTVAEAQGHAVTLVSDSEWAGMSTAQFAAFDALVIGDDGCQDEQSVLDPVVANRATWAPAVTGNITVNTFDPFAHPNEGQSQEFVANSINFAAGGSGTGLYFSLGCYYNDASDPTTIDLLDQFGTFTVDKENGDHVTILRPDHPLMAGLTDTGLADWGSTAHEHFTSFPSSFMALAEETENVDPGLPVVLATTPIQALCKGKTATMIGTAGNEVLSGSPHQDVIAGLGGNDTINAGGGNDLVCGGPGNDRLKGAAGKDTLLGEGGKDLLAGGGGAGDVCKGGAGKDTAKGNCEKGKA